MQSGLLGQSTWQPSGVGGLPPINAVADDLFHVGGSLQKTADSLFGARPESGEAQAPVGPASSSLEGLDRSITGLRNIAAALRSQADRLSSL